MERRHRYFTCFEAGIVLISSSLRFAFFQNLSIASKVSFGVGEGDGKTQTPRQGVGVTTTGMEGVNGNMGMGEMILHFFMFSLKPAYAHTFWKCSKFSGFEKKL